MIATLLQNRSGRIIALCRMVLAIVFFLAVWIDPAQPARAIGPGYILLACYLVLSLFLMALAMTSWWWDHKLAAPALVVDTLTFLAGVILTESAADDFTSPFLAFFVFLMLSATIRWDWRVTAVTGIVVTALYLSVGFGLALAGIDFDLIRFARRVAYMLVLALVLIWFGLQRRDQRIGRFNDAREPAAGLKPPLDESLGFAIEQAGAQAGAIAWSEGEEPATELRTQAIAAPLDRLVPGQLPDDYDFDGPARLFSADRARSLRATGRGRPDAIGVPSAEPFADLLEIGECLAIPFAGGGGHGEILLTGITGVCADHVMIGQLIGREVGAGFDRHAALLLSHQAALDRSRDALARDLHDIVAQSLAGAALRLEGLRKSIRAGHDPEDDIVQLKAALRFEQRQVREMIERLRESGPQVRPIALAGDLSRLASSLSAHWGITVRFESRTPIDCPAEISYEIGNIVREAVANAVRHGQADEVAIGSQILGDGIEMTVTDNGCGFPLDADEAAPKSIRERIERRDGSLAVQSLPSGTRLTITLPWRATR